MYRSNRYAGYIALSGGPEIFGRPLFLRRKPVLIQIASNGILPDR